MTDSTIPAPRYKLWETLHVLFDSIFRLNKELKEIARQPGPPGKDGTDGKDGRDGLSIDDLSMEYDGERTFTFRFSNGKVTKEFPFVIPIPIDRGTYKSDVTYAKGDMVSHGGSMFIAQRETSDKPEQSDAWRLGVKRGRDGKDGKNGERGERGFPGRGP